MKSNFYLFKSGQLKRKDHSVVPETKEETILIPVEQIDSLFYFGEIAVNKRLLELFNRYKIEIVFFNYYGTNIGRFCPCQYGIGKLLLEQVHCYEDEKKRLTVSQAIQKASLHNCLAVLEYYHKNGVSLEKQIASLKKVISEADDVSTVEEMLLLEARAKKDYYSAFDILLENTDFIFNRRSYQPPENEMNSLMCFGYHLLYAVVLKELDMSRLYPEIAFIHSDIRKGPGLHFDLADVYKPFIIDRMIFRMVRKHKLHLTDFEPTEKGIYLNTEIQKSFVAEFDQELLKTDKVDGKNYTRTSIIRKDIHSLTAYIEGKIDKPRFFLMKW